ncbi:LysR family transcriptional regulator [Paracoccus sp. p4-l81]|uniref:LysR family transcriptional regulator n=1 Tax=unclassified Paracoccus (in: a-proteobacteria) TaxID=2688777 RepID=UPI0035B72E75
MVEYSEKLNTSALRAMAPRGLRALLAVAETGSYAAAADRLGLTAPALHAQIKTLEGLLGADLLRRVEGGGSAPTEIGAHVCDTARRIDEQLLRMAEDVAALRSGRAGRVVLGTVSTAKYFGPLLVRMLQQALPELELRLRVGNRQEVIDGIASGRLDLAIMGRPPRAPAVEAAVIGPHPHVIVAPPGHRLSGQPAIPVPELYAETFIQREDGSGTRILATRWLDRVGEGYPFTQIEMDSNETIKQAVMAGMGIALLSQHTVTQELADGRLVTLPLPGLPMERHWFLVRAADRPPNPARARVWDQIVAMQGSFLPSPP